MEALVLRVRASGESNREASFLTREAGIVRALVYGGPKSKLRAFVSPFNSGLLYLYHDPVRDSYKVSDFDARAWRPKLRENYDRMMSAAAIAETILAGHGGGSNWHEALQLADNSLNALENADAAVCARIWVRFLWLWADILGAAPEDNSILNINSGAIHWLEIAAKVEPSTLNRYVLDEGLLKQAENCCADILSAAIGRRLRSWSW